MLGSLGLRRRLFSFGNFVRRIDVVSLGSGQMSRPTLENRLAPPAQSSAAFLVATCGHLRCNSVMFTVNNGTSGLVDLALALELVM